MGSFDLAALDRESYELILSGFLVTCKLAGGSLFCAILIGAIVGTARWANLPVLRQIIWLYIETARNTPPLVQILFWYFSASVILPEWAFMRVRATGYEFTAAAVALSLYHGAFMAEVFRAGLNSVGSGQFQAARALGMNFWQAMTRIMAPQVARITAPPMVNEAVSLVKSVLVSNPSGGNAPTSGAALQYQVQATVTGTGTARSFAIDDLIPTGTTYVAGSLRLNGTALTDAADADAGEFQAAVPRVRVLLGDLSQASGPQTVSFTVTIR